MAEMNIQELYKLFEDNNLSPKNQFIDQKPQQETTNFIKTGDIVVAQFKNREFRGEVSKIYEKTGIDFYDIKVGETIISVKLDNIIEHYPKNRKFDTQIKKENIKKIQPEEIIKEDKKIDIPIQTKQEVINKKIPKPIIIEENKNLKKDDIKEKPQIKEEEPQKILKDPKKVEKEENDKNPQNKDFTSETVKVIGKITQFSGNLKLQEVIDFLAKHGIDKEKCWYFITEKNKEIHLIRNNERGFQMYPFVISFVDLKIKDKLTESKKQIKIAGNNNFSIISNIPDELYDLTKNSLIALLSQTKK
jgi:hypothetical protein